MLRLHILTLLRLHILTLPRLHICVAVFLERQFAEFLPKLADLQASSAAGATGAAEAQAAAEDKMVDILQKSWKKMGQLGRAAALKLPLGPKEAELVGRALAPPAA